MVLITLPRTMNTSFFPFRLGVKVLGMKYWLLSKCAVTRFEVPFGQLASVPSACTIKEHPYRRSTR